MHERVHVRLRALSPRLGNAEWLDGSFSPGDLLMVTLLRRLRELRTADHQVVSAAIKWVEQGVAPEKIVASQLGADGKSCGSVRSAPILRKPGTRGRAT